MPAGVEVTLVDANHCPGAVQFCFQLPAGVRYVHCGDARYCAAMQHNATLQRFVGARAVFLVCSPYVPQLVCRCNYTAPASLLAVCATDQVQRTTTRVEAAVAGVAESILHLRTNRLWS